MAIAHTSFPGRLVVLFSAALLAATPLAHSEDPVTSGSKRTFVIIHGAWGGGWAFKEVERLLRQDGNTVYRPTLTGQGERVHLASTNIDLSLHIQDVVNVLEWEDLHDVVLVGHSYGGMVVTGVADRTPDRIQHLIYLDAIVPEDGESANAAFGSLNRERPITNGFVIPIWVKPDMPPPHDVPHPAKTLSEPIALTNLPASSRIPTTYILTVDKGKEPDQDRFYRFYERAGARGWNRAILEGDHNVQWSKPAELVGLLETAAAEDDGFRLLFNGKDTTGWHLRRRQGHNSWTVEDGVLKNTVSGDVHGTDLVTDEKFWNFTVHFEYLVPEGSNSGFYLRGRHELQILGDYPSGAATPVGNGALYNFRAPDQFVSRPGDQWQTVDATIIDNRITVVHNGVTTHDKVECNKATGSELDNNLDQPGALFLQGDHGTVWFRNIRIKEWR